MASGASRPLGMGAVGGGAFDDCALLGDRALAAVAGGGLEDEEEEGEAAVDGAPFDDEGDRGPAAGRSGVGAAFKGPGAAFYMRRGSRQYSAVGRRTREVSCVRRTSEINGDDTRDCGTRALSQSLACCELVVLPLPPWLGVNCQSLVCCWLLCVLVLCAAAVAVAPLGCSWLLSRLSVVRSHSSAHSKRSQQHSRQTQWPLPQHRRLAAAQELLRSSPAGRSPPSRH